MTFETEYDAFMTQHMEKRSGESLQRLQDGHGHAEKLFLQHVWWPAIGHFNHLHPEYAVHDFKDGSRFLDFAYIRGPYKVCFEIDGYGPHSRDAGRWQFADNLLRQNHLVIEGWKVIRFAYDDIHEKPRRCQQLIQQLLGRWFGDEHALAELTAKQKEIVRLAIRQGGPITPADVSGRLRISDRYARELMHRLAELDMLVPSSGTKRIRSYRLNVSGKPLFL